MCDARESISFATMTPYLILSSHREEILEFKGCSKCNVVHLILMIQYFFNQNPSDFGPSTVSLPNW
jgi:hypothetical protein